jgi:hypothetical protein
VTIFAAMASAFPNELTQGRIHQAAWPVAKSRRALAWRRETKLPTLIKVSYSSRSSGQSEPSVDLSASASIRPCISASARSRSSASALSRSRHSPTAPSTRSKTALDEFVGTSRKIRLQGRKAEDGVIDPKYPLKETPSLTYVQRTEWNVRDTT